MVDVTRSGVDPESKAPGNGRNAHVDIDVAGKDSSQAVIGENEAALAVHDALIVVGQADVGHGHRGHGRALFKQKVAGKRHDAADIE